MLRQASSTTDRDDRGGSPEVQEADVFTRRRTRHVFDSTAATTPRVPRIASRRDACACMHIDCARRARNAVIGRRALLLALPVGSAFVRRAHRGRAGLVDRLQVVGTAMRPLDTLVRVLVTRK